MKKRFKILLIIDIILLLLYVFLRTICITNNGFEAVIYGLGAIIFFIASIIVLIVTIILGIIDSKKEQEKNIKNKLYILMTIMLLINVCLPIGFRQVENFKSNNDKKKLNEVNEKYNNLSNNIIGKIKNIENNKYIYLYYDLLEIDSTFKNGPLNDEIDKSSYITYYDGKARICISDGNYKISGNEDNLKTEKIVRESQICHYDFADIGDTPYQHNEGEYYLKYYINKKYGLEVESVKTNYDCSNFYYCTRDNYTVNTSYGTITVELNVVDNKIEETDNYGFVYASQLLRKNLIDYMDSNNYTIKPYIINGNSNLTDISSIDINNLKNELWVSFTIVIKKDNRTEEDMKKIADKMVSWYKNHNIYGSTNFILLDSENYNDVNEYNYNSIKMNYNVNNLISCTIKKNGDVKIN